MKNLTKLFFPTLMPLLLLAGCYYPYYEEGVAVQARPTAPVVYGGAVYSGYGYAWPGYYWPYSYYGPAYYSYYGFYPYSYGSSWRAPSPRYYSPPPPSYRPQGPPSRPGTPRYRPEWRDGRGGSPPSNAPAFRPDGPRFQPQSDTRSDDFRSYPPDAGQSYPVRSMPHGRR